MSDASAQFKLAYRHYPAEQRARQEQLDHVIAAWRAAPRSDKNNDMLSAWLRASIRSSMPGSRAALPPTPEFAVPVPPSVEVTPSEAHSDDAGAAEKSEPTAEDKSAGDPFRDDPLAEQDE